MKNKMALDIGHVAKQSGLPVSTLRFYEEKGLIRSEGRHGLRRLFGPRILEQLEFIALGRRAGFSLKDLHVMFASNGQFKIDRKLLLTQAQKMSRDIKRLTAIRDCLQHVAHCSAPSHIECPKFQKLLRLAGKAEGRYRSKHPLKDRVVGL